MADHLLDLFAAEEEVNRRVLDFLAAGLEDGECALVIATPARRAALEVLQATYPSRVVFMDAAATLEQFMGPEGPDGARFTHALRPLLDHLASAGNGRLRAFGEMVAVLVERGMPAQAVELERLWNELLEGTTASLLCAYPMAAFAGPNSKWLPGVLAAHAVLHRPKNDHDSQVARLRREVADLRARLRRLDGAVRAPKVLLVDDEPDTLDSYRVLIEASTAARVVVARSGAEGLAILARQEVDAIVSDYRMPAMDGVEFLRQAKELTPGTPTMILTAFIDPHLRGHELGQVRLMSKSADPAVVVREVTRLVGGVHALM